MTNLEMLKEVFRDSLDLEGDVAYETLSYGKTEEWDSVAHMQLVANIEEAFDLMVETVDVIAWSDFTIVQNTSATPTTWTSMLEGKVAYVTGSSRGIGAAVAETFASYGASVIINGHSDPAALSAAAARISARHGVRVEAIAADQADPQQIGSSYRYIFGSFKRLDILVNNAGVLDDALLGMISDEALERTFQVNTLAVARNMQSATRLLSRAGSGSIINVSSIVGVNGNAGQVTYAGSKAAVLGMTRSAAKELAPKQVRVNAIAPGFIATDMTSSLAAAKYEERLASIGMGRIGTSQDVANVALFLASDLSSYVTGQVIGVDGSMLI